MASQNSAKGNPASKRMMNPNNKAKRVRNKSKNERLKAKNQHPKQLRAKANRLEMEPLGLKNRKRVHRLRQEQKSA